MRYWRYINILSLDIALGAVAGCGFFAGMFGVSLLPNAYFSLGVIVWMIYTVDHLLDASRDVVSLSTARHRFHRDHAKTLKYVLLAAAILVVVQVFFVRIPVLISGLIVGAFVALYIALQRHLAWLKEIAGALLYTAGIVLAPASLLSRSIYLSEWIIVFLFGLTAYINLMICSLYDVNKDRADGHRSFSTEFGIERTQKIIAGAFVVAALLFIILLITPRADANSVIILGLMNVALLLVYRQPAYFSHTDNHRLLADVAFVFPILYYVLPWR